MLLGDAFDRGEETQETAEFLLSLFDQRKLIYILGSHEELLVKCLQQLARGDDPINIAMSYNARNGTWQTLLDLAGMTLVEAVRNPQGLVSRAISSRVYKELIASCVDYYETNRFVFVHGFIPCHVQGIKPNTSYSFDENWRDASPESWKRGRWSNGAEIAVKHGIRVPNKTIVCGHWHASYAHCHLEGNGSEWGDDADFTPYYSKDGSIIAIDACAAFSQKINCLVYDSEEI